MTEEDQKLVAMAALHGAKFIRAEGDKPGRMMWSVVDFAMRKWTVGRAAALYLNRNDLMSDEDYYAYERRTDRYNEPQEIDPEFIASVLA